MVARALKGIPTLVSKIKPYEVYKPHFDNLRRISLENSSNWSKRRGWVNKVKNIPEDIQLAEDVTKIFIRNPTLRGKTDVLENYRKTRTDLGEKDFHRKISSLITPRVTKSNIDPDVSVNLLGDTGIPFFPAEVGQGYLNYSAARRGQMYKMEEFKDFVLDKFSRPVNPAKNAFKGQEGIGYKYTEKAGPITINKGIKQITPYLKQTKEGRIALKNLEDYKALREEPGSVAILKRQENIKILNKDLEGKLHSGDDLTRWEAKENLKEFSNAVARFE